ncbi:hypothetical protein F441_19457 [Phytophthora nicotianae CJ01A1]|uniref:Uncharacterized protein n=4 Tax=Phytophthora nicotianae TaxID=4792 RepID=V9E3Q4_PHYNI|nr:hypothetical protein F443_19631 [Phytophthora nicotianae P1569]ETP03599.1 hypothetical protein F441_19457 [Phytophthora nicotianae CJ01A1]ETP31751.1 hypothetical protein F442_19409 [Phytophthora nicotianae P10297]
MSSAQSLHQPRSTTLSCVNSDDVTRDPECQLARLEDWAAMTTKTWAKEVQLELQAERDYLEHEVKRRLQALVINNDREGHDGNYIVRCLVLERGLLQSENLRLQQRLSVFDHFMIQSNKAVQDISPPQREDSVSPSVREASQSAPWATHVAPHGPGWRVYFPNDKPSFYFSPFTREEYDSKFDQCDEILAAKLPVSSIMGRLFG